MDPNRTLTVAGTPDGIHRAMSALRAWTEPPTVTPETRRRVLTVVDEVLSNVVRHGFKDRPGEMTVTQRVAGGTLEVEVADTAPAFNPLGVPPPDVSRPLDERRPGGLGVALVRALSDEAAYAHRMGRNVLTLGWRLDPVRTGPAHGDS